MKLILLPGMDGTGILFKPLLKELNKSLDITIFTYPQNIEQSYKSLTDWVLPQLPDSEEYCLVAESFSGPIAFNIAARRKANLIGVIFVATFLENPRPSISWLESVLPLNLLLKFKAPDFFIRQFLLGNNAPKSLISTFWKSIMAVKTSVLQERLSSVTKLTMNNQCVNIPCGYIGGTNDYLVPNRCVNAFKIVCSDINEYFISGPHFLLQASSKQCVRIIEKEIKRFKSYQPNTQ